MDGMLERTNWLGQVTDGAGIQGAGVSLQINKLDCIARLAAFCNRVGAIVAPFAVHSVVSFGLAIKHLVLASGDPMAGVAARLIQPGV